MEKINNRLANKIKKHLKTDEQPIIVLISGANGIGKTTIAFYLSNILKIKQRVGLGTVVKTLIAMTSNRKKLNYQNMDNNISSLLSLNTLHKQSLIISKTINLLIQKYISEGISCIIEGVQLFPQNLHGKRIHFHLYVDNMEKYKKQLQDCDTRKPRILSTKEFNNLMNLDENLKTSMNNSSVYFIGNSMSLIAIINKMLHNIEISLNIK